MQFKDEISVSFGFLSPLDMLQVILCRYLARSLPGRWDTQWSVLRGFMMDIFHRYRSCHREKGLSTVLCQFSCLSQFSSPEHGEMSELFPQTWAPVLRPACPARFRSESTQSWTLKWPFPRSAERRQLGLAQGLRGGGRLVPTPGKAAFLPKAGWRVPPLRWEGGGAVTGAEGPVGPRASGCFVQRVKRFLYCCSCDLIWFWLAATIFFCGFNLSKVSAYRGRVQLPGRLFALCGLSVFIGIGAWPEARGGASLSGADCTPVSNC